VAYSVTEGWYLEFETMPKLDSGIYLIERNPTALKHKSLSTCLIALLGSGTESIQKLCKFVIQPYAVQEQILILAQGRLLLQFLKQYTLKCRIQRKFMRDANYLVHV
jgi:hypothetical protein